LPFQAAPSADPIADAKALADLLQKRMLMALIEQVGQGVSSGRPAQEMLEAIEQGVSATREALREQGAGRMRPALEQVPEVLKELSKLMQARKVHGRPTVGIPTGLPTLDKAIGGLQPGIHMLAAEPGAGKTTLALNFLLTAAKQGVPALFLSFEEPLFRLMVKLVCIERGLDAKGYFEGLGDLGRFQEAIRSMAGALGNIYLLEGSSKTTVAQVRARLLKALTLHKADTALLVVDYLQRWASSSRERDEYRHLVAGRVTELRDVSNALKCPILLISSQNRERQGMASLASFKESGDIEYSADSALFLRRKDESVVNGASREVELALKKNRYGSTLTVRLVFTPQTGKIGEASAWEV
jgi:replicative DNA helicase